MTMTAEQLEELLAMLDNGHTLDPGRAMDGLFSLAPSLARKVIAAERLVEAVGGWINMTPLCDEKLIQAYKAYREASK